jgi:hypothetical protein
MCVLERFFGFMQAGKLRDEIFNEEFDAVAEAQTGWVNDVVDGALVMLDRFRSVSVA